MNKELYQVVRYYNGNKEFVRQFNDFDKANDFANNQAKRDLENKGYNIGVYQVVEIVGGE